MTAQLRFTSIELIDFRSFAGHHRFKLDQPPGLYYVTGRNLDDPQLGANGAGKSTLLTDALLWVLFEKTTRDGRPADSIVPWTATKKKVSVRLDFERGGVAYSVTRQRGPNRLLLSGINSEKQVDNAEVERALGMNEEMFRRTVVQAQFGSLFLDLKPEAQSQMFTLALNLDVWLRAADNATKEAKAARRELSDITMALGRAEAKLEAVNAQLESGRRASTAWVDRHEDEVAAANAAEAKAKAALDALPSPKRFAAVDLDALRKAQRAAATAERDAERAWASAKNAVEDALQRVADTASEVKRYEAAEASGTCPECGQQVKPKHIADRLKEAKQAAKRASHEHDRAVAALAEADKALGDAEEAAKDTTDAYDGGVAADTERQQAARLRATLEAALHHAEDLVDRKRAETNPYIAQIEEGQRAAADLEADIAEAKDLKTKGESLALANEFWADTFRVIRMKRLDSALRELEMTTTRYAEALGLAGWAIRFQTERETQSGATSIGLSILLYPPEQQEPVRWSSYCGGEVQRWQLAIAFGLSEVLLERAGLAPNLEVYDEPTRGMSPEGIATLIAELRDRALGQGKAIYLVDHHAFDAGHFDGTLTITKQGGESEARWV